MLQLNDREALINQLAEWRKDGQTIGFVPTMGNLHEGHVELVNRARAQADKVVASIFVNPTQFGPNEDLDNYPRTLDADLEKLTKAGCDLVFFPNEDTMYPWGKQSKVCLEGITQAHCGASRPDHFDGVTTVVMKFFNLVQPTWAYFGKKDYQQLATIAQMVRDFFMPITLVPVDTVREDSGLAKSSRNGYLTPEQKQQAAALYRTLIHMKSELEAGKASESVRQAGLSMLTEAGFKPDYLNIVDRERLDNCDDASQPRVILAAAHMGSTRLIDNIEVAARN